MGNGDVVEAKGKMTNSENTKKGRKYIHDVLLVLDLEQNLFQVCDCWLRMAIVFTLRKILAKSFYRSYQNHVIAEVEMQRNISFPIEFHYDVMSLKCEVVEGIS